MSDSRRLLGESWWYRLPALGAAAALAVSVLYRYLQPRPSLTQDSALFLYSGQRFAAGDVPYRHVWDIKPPAIYELTGAVGLLVGGNPEAMWLLTGALTVGAIAGTVALVSLLASAYGAGDELAALAGGLVFSFPYLFDLAGLGIRPKYFAVFAGLAGLRYALRDRPLPAVALVTLAAAFWQIAIGFWAVGLLVVADRQGLSDALLNRLVGGMAAVVLVVMGPFVAAGVTPTLLSQVVATPFLDPESGAFLERLGAIGGDLGVATLPVLLGAVGAGRHAYSEQTVTAMSPLVLIGWFSAGAFLFDHDGPADLLPLWLVSLVGVGLFLQYVTDRGSETPVVRMTPVVLAGAIVLAAWALDPPSVMVRSGGLPGDLFWTRGAPDSCHIRKSPAEMAWIKAVPGHDELSARCDIRWETLIELLRQGIFS